MRFRIIVVVFLSTLIQACETANHIPRDQVIKIDTVNIDVVASPTAYQNTSEHNKWWYATGGAIGALLAESPSYGDETSNSKINAFPVQIEKIAERAIRKEISDTSAVKWTISDQFSQYKLEVTVSMFGFLKYGQENEFRPAVLIITKMLNDKQENIWHTAEFISKYNKDTIPIDLNNLSQASIENSYESAFRLVMREILDEI